MITQSETIMANKNVNINSDINHKTSVYFYVDNYNTHNINKIKTININYHRMKDQMKRVLNCLHRQCIKKLFHLQNIYWAMKRSLINNDTIRHSLYFRRHI